MTARSFRQLLPLYLACYAIVLAISAMGVWLIFAARPVLFGLALWLRLNRPKGLALLPDSKESNQ